MKKYIFIVLSFVAININAQFKEPAFTTESPKDGITRNSSNSLFGFFDTNNFSMHHSFGLSFSSFAGEGLSLATYTNSMMYKFSDNMNVQLDASLIASPYSSLGKDFQKSLQGIYISRAAFNYKPWDDVSISIQYRSYPNYFYNPYGRYGNFGSSFYGGFNDYDNNPFMF